MARRPHYRGKVDEMKKLLVLLALAFVMCVPEWSFAESQKPTVAAQLYEISLGLTHASETLRHISNDMRDIIRAKATCELMITLMNIEQAYEFYATNAQRLFVHAGAIPPSVDREQQWVGLHIVELQRAKKTINDTVMVRLGKVSGGLGNMAASHLVDKARDTIRSSLPLFDEAIQILESKKPASP